MNITFYDIFSDQEFQINLENYKEEIQNDGENFFDRQKQRKKNQEEIKIGKN